MINRLLIIIIILIVPVHLVGSVHETLPSWHWAYRYIDDLRLRGCFTELYSMNRPYTRHDVAFALIKTKVQLGKGDVVLTSSDLKLLDRLEREFAFETNRIQNDTLNCETIYAGTRLQGDLDKPDDGELKYRGIYRTRLSASVGHYFTVYNGLNFNQYLMDDPDYMGKKWRGIAAYTEQAYAAVGVGRFYFKFGRDFLRWGCGERGTFLFSDVALPLNQFIASVRLGSLKYTFLASVLDETISGSLLHDAMGGEPAKRYVSAHRLDANLFHGALQLAITETVLYGGIHRQMDWAFLNPFLPYYLLVANNYGSGNMLGSIDIIYYPVRRLKCYGSLLIDDIQVEKTGPGDLEPNEIGWLMGSKWADPFGASGLTISGEYVRVTNRTYKTPTPWETFLHRNVTLGHPLGNDFDYWQVGVSKWFLGSLWCKVSYSQTRKGEGSLFTPWDESWMDYTVEEGYSEPFPTGVVEKGSEFGFLGRFYPSTQWGVELEVHSRQWSNAGHVEGERESGVRWRVGVWWDGGIRVRL